MGKGGKKAKTYKTPDSKYLVVVDPWGTPGHPWFINNVAAWFETMLMDDYPHEEVKTIFTQRTHGNIIVELADSIDIQPYIGSHHHAMFLKPPYDQSDSISHIYEYDYEKQNDPTRRSWTANYPSNYDVSIFPIKRPYPSPQPAPPPPYNVSYAKRPKGMQLLAPATEPIRELSQSATIASEDAPSSSSAQPQREESKPKILTDKQDPYEQADAAEQFLSALHLPTVKPEDENHNSDSKFRVKLEEPISSIKREPEAVSLADAVVTPKKEEAVDLPSLQLEEPVSINVEQDVSQGNDYEPSAELMAAFADLSGDLQSQASQATASPAASSTPASFVKREVDEPSLSVASGTRVKDEPVDNYLIPPSPSLEQRDQRERSATLATEREWTAPPGIRVKTEPRDIDMIPSREAAEASSFSKTRDPRLLKRVHQPNYNQTQNQEVPEVSKNRDPRLLKHGREAGDDNTSSREIPSFQKTRDPRLLKREHPERQPDDDKAPPRTRDPRLLKREHPGHQPGDDKSLSKTRDPRLMKRGGDHSGEQPDDDHPTTKIKRIKSEWD